MPSPLRRSARRLQAAVTNSVLGHGARCELCACWDCCLSWSFGKSCSALCPAAWARCWLCVSRCPSPTSAELGAVLVPPPSWGVGISQQPAGTFVRAPVCVVPEKETGVKLGNGCIRERRAHRQPAVRAGDTQLCLVPSCTAGKAVQCSGRFRALQQQELVERPT